MTKFPSKVGVGVGVTTGVGVGVGVADPPGVGVSVGVAEGLAVAVGVGVAVTSGGLVAVAVGVTDGVALGVGVSSGVAVAVAVGVAFGVALGVGVSPPWTLAVFEANRPIASDRLASNFRPERNGCFAKVPQLEILEKLIPKSPLVKVQHLYRSWSGKWMYGCMWFLSEIRKFFLVPLLRECKRVAVGAERVSRRCSGSRVGCNSAARLTCSHGAMSPCHSRRLDIARRLQRFHSFFGGGF